MADYSYGGQGPSYTDILRFARERLGLTPQDMAAAPAQYGAQPQETSLFAPPTAGALSAAQAAPYAGGAAFGGADTGPMMTAMPVAPTPPGPATFEPSMMTTMPVTRGIDGGSLLVDESGRSAPIPPGPATFPPPTMTTMPVQGGMSGALSAARPETAGGLSPSQAMLFNKLRGMPGQGSDEDLMNYAAGLSDYQALASLASVTGETKGLKNWATERGYDLAQELANQYGITGDITMGSGVRIPAQGAFTPSGAGAALTGPAAGGLARAMGAGAPATAADAMSSVLGGTSKPNVGAVLDAYLEAQKRGDRHAGSILARSGLSDAEIAKALNAATGRNLTEEQVRTSLDIYQPGGVYEKAKLGMPNVVAPSVFSALPKVQDPKNPTAPTQEAPYGYARSGKGGAGYRPITASEHASVSASLAASKAASEAREAFRKQHGWYEDSPEQQFVNKYGFTPSQVFAMTPDQRLALASKYGGATFSNDLSQFASSYAPKP